MKEQTTIFVIKGYDQLTGEIYVRKDFPRFFKTREEAQEHCTRMEWVKEVKAAA